MVKAFGLTALFWSLFVFVNTISDAILFYSVFPWYKNMDLWHNLKYLWIAFAVFTGWYACMLHEEISQRFWRTKDQLKRFGVIVFVTLFFLLLRWGLHEGLMEVWRQQ